MIRLKDKLYFRGYEIESMESPFFILTDKEYDLLDACYWMVENKATIRKTAENTDFSKSTLHYQIHHELKYLSPELYDAVKKQMKENIDRRRRKYGSSSRN